MMKLWLNIWKSYKWELRGEKLYERRSSSYRRNFLQLQKESLKKFRLVRVSNPWPFTACVILIYNTLIYNALIGQLAINHLPIGKRQRNTSTVKLRQIKKISVLTRSKMHR